MVSVASSARAKEVSSSEDGERRPAREYFIGGGLTGMAAPSVADFETVSGVNVVLYYGGRHFAGVAQFIVGRAPADEYDVIYGGYGFGARYRLLDVAVTPFVGLGLNAASSAFYADGHDS
jgi:hypothetical protein